MTYHVAPTSRGQGFAGDTLSEAGTSLSALLPPEGRSRLLRRPLRTTCLAAGVALLAAVSYPPGVRAIIAACVSAVLIVVAATDLERRIIPNRIVVPATVLVLVAQAILAPAAIGTYLAFASGAAFLFMLPSLAGRAWMGMGDVKLIALLGAALGSGVVTALVLAYLCLFPVALATVIRRGAAGRRVMLPFGPFLALGGLIVLILPHLTGAAS